MPPSVLLPITKAAVRPQDGATSYDHVFEGGAPGPGSAGFHADAVIARADITLIDHHFFAGADIDAVPVLGPPLIEYSYMVHGEVRAIMRIKDKFGRIADRHAAKQHMMTIDKGNHVGAQKIAGGKIVFRGRLRIFLFQLL